LGLPVESGGADGVVVVAGGGGEVLFGFVEGDEEEFGVGGGVEVAAFADAAFAGLLGEAAGDEDFVAGVAAVEVERDFRGMGALVDVEADLVLEGAAEVLQFGAGGRGLADASDGFAVGDAGFAEVDREEALGEHLFDAGVFGGDLRWRLLEDAGDGGEATRGVDVEELVVVFDDFGVEGIGG
jgi:hypothetical protein